MFNAEHLITNIPQMHTLPLDVKNGFILLKIQYICLDFLQNIWFPTVDVNGYQFLSFFKIAYLVLYRKKKKARNHLTVSKCE